MAWTAPRTWVTGEVVTASLMNTHVRDNLRDRRGLDGDAVFEDDVSIGAYLLKTTNLGLKEEDSSTMAVRNAADDAYKSLKTDDLLPQGSIVFTADGEAISAPNTDDYYLKLQARLNSSGLSEIARLAGGSQPRFVFKRAINIGAAVELTISSGAVTATAGCHTIDTQSDAASDDLDSINGGTDGDIITIRPENAARTVVVKHGTGNIKLCAGEDFSMDESNDSLALQRFGSNWVELSRQSQTGTTQGDPVLYGVNDGSIPSGIIVIWHGTIANIPSGYVICDGNNSTPNLLAKFIEGVATAATNPGTTGGATSKTSSGHTHSIQAGSAYAGAGGTISNTTSSSTDSITDIRPSYYDVAFLMKT